MKLFSMAFGAITGTTIEEAITGTAMGCRLDPDKQGATELQEECKTCPNRFTCIFLAPEHHSELLDQEVELIFKSLEEEEKL